MQECPWYPLGPYAQASTTQQTLSELQTHQRPQTDRKRLRTSSSCHTDSCGSKQWLSRTRRLKNRTRTQTYHPEIDLCGGKPITNKTLTRYIHMISSKYQNGVRIILGMRDVHSDSNEGVRNWHLPKISWVDWKKRMNRSVISTSNRWVWLWRHVGDITCVLPSARQRTIGIWCVREILGQEMIEWTRRC